MTIHESRGKDVPFGVQLETTTPLHPADAGNAISGDANVGDERFLTRAVNHSPVANHNVIGHDSRFHAMIS
jgi:hypothetical protein